MRTALRAALKHWPELLAQSLVYSIIITLGMARLTLLLRDLHLDVTNIGRVTMGLADMSRAVGIRALGGFVPDPGSPFFERFAFVRSTLSRTAYYYWYADRSRIPTTDWWMWAIGLAGAGLILVTETLFRLRTVLIMHDQAPPKGYGGLVDSVRAGWRNFGYITLNIWLLRLVLVVIVVAFTVVPTTFAQSGIVPAAFALIFDTRLMAQLPKPIW